jgi:hypothetical protein
MQTKIDKKFPYGSYLGRYANGLGISNDATTPLTLLDVAAGDMLDSTGTFQIGSYLPMVINSANVGLNGIDTGVVADSTLYVVWLIADPQHLKPTGCMISLSYTQPLMPFGYSAFALIGYVATDPSGHFLKGYWTDTNTTSRLFMYDAPQASPITAGTSTAYANVNLTGLVPLVNNLPVWIASTYTPNAAGDTLHLQPGNATGNSIVIAGQVAHVVVTSNSLVMAQDVVIASVNSPVINYEVSSGSDSVAIDVAGYQFFL